MLKWGRVINEKKPHDMPVKIKRPWKAPDFDSEGKAQFTPTHVMLSMYPDLDDKGEVATVMSCVTDVRFVFYP